MRFRRSHPSIDVEHSHPGTGVLATCPSQIDRVQYRDWTRDFPDLLGVILTADGTVRFWGDGVERTRATLRFRGAGAQPVETDVYRLV